MDSRFDSERLLYAAKLLLSYAGGGMQRTNLINSLFYLDLFWLRDTGATFTGARWVALPQGPVVDDYLEVLIRPLLQDPTVAEEEVKLGRMVAKRLHVHVEPPPPSDEHLEVVAHRVADFVGGKRAVDISEFTHENPAWQVAIEKGNGTAINMVHALSQVTEDDPWLDEALTDEERRQIADLLAQDRYPL